MTAVVVNYQTPDLLVRAVESFVEHYPSVPVVVVDNGSADGSREVIERLVAEHATVRAEYLATNVGHGPAMHHVAARTDDDWLFLLDSDTETRVGGFLEKMLELAGDDERVLGVGEIAPINRRGYLDPRGTPALVAAFMLIRVSAYRSLPPFRNHGAPGIDLFHGAAREGYRLADFPIQDYIAHLCRGTVQRHGYASLGIAARINHLLQKLGV